MNLIQIPFAHQALPHPLSLIAWALLPSSSQLLNIYHVWGQESAAVLDHNEFGSDRSILYRGDQKWSHRRKTCPDIQNVFTRHWGAIDGYTEKIQNKLLF